MSIDVGSCASMDGEMHSGGNASGGGFGAGPHEIGFGEPGGIVLSYFIFRRGRA